MKKSLLIALLTIILVVSCLALTACNHEHNYGMWEVVKQATCTEDGLREGTCLTCAEKKQEAIPATGHTFGEWTIITPATCTEAGQKERVCSCGEKEVRDIPATGHSFGEWAVLEDATCTEAGQKERVCACGEKETETVAATGHSHTAVVTAPTCTTQGYTTHTCLACGDSYVDAYVSAPEAHKLTVSLSDKLRVTCTYCDYSDEYDLAIDTNKLYGFNQFKQNDNKDFYNFYIDLYNAATIFANCQDDLVEVNNEYVIAKIDTQSYTLSDIELMSVWKIFYMENPQFYWLTNTVDFYDNGFLLLADEAYSKYEDRARYDLLISDMLGDAAKSIACAKNELEVVFNLHDFILSNNEYAYIDGTLTPETEMWAHNLVGFAEKNKGVCEAYAKTFLYFSYIFDIDNIIVTGQSKGENHAWNLVEIDGDWYYFDFTWDDRESEGLAYNYFGLSFERMQKDHANDTTSNEGFNYLYNLPDALADIELVRLYKDGVDIGLRTSIDNAIDSMTNATSEYTVELFRYEYIPFGSGGVTAVIDRVHHLSKDIPDVKQVTISGIKQDAGSNGIFSSFIVSYVTLTESISSFTDLILQNISMNMSVFVSGIFQEKTLDLQDNSLTLEGYYNSISGNIVGSESSWLIAVTEQDSAIEADIEIGNVLIDGYSLKFSGNAHITNLYSYGIFWYSTMNYVANDIVIDNIYGDLSASITISSDNGDTNISIGNVFSQNLFFRLNFGEISNYPNISFVGESVEKIELFLDGNVTMISIDIFTGETVFTNYHVAPLHLIGQTLFVASEEILENIDLIFEGGSYKDRSDLCEINDNGEVYFDLPNPDESGFVIKDSALIGYTGNDVTVVIPEGVTTIRTEAFLANKNMYQIVLPSTLTQIEENAFVGCSKLVVVINKSQLDIKCGTTDFGSVALNAFSVSPEEGNITLVEDKFVFYLGEINYLVSYIGNDATVVLPQTEYDYFINQYAFAENDTLEQIKFSSKVKGIGDRAFYGCDLLQSVYLPASVEQLGWSTFASCTSLKEVIIDPNSKLTSISYGTFMACSNLTTVVMPNSITSIEGYAFSDCISLANIAFSENLTRIEHEAFSRCTSLTSITIPESVISIGNWAFNGCDNLSEVCYAGTEEQWNSISIGTSNEYLTNANIVFNHTGEEN